jgi:hypothetical protein
MSDYGSGIGNGPSQIYRPAGVRKNFETTASVRCVRRLKVTHRSPWKSGAFGAA